MPHGLARRLLLAKQRKEAHERRASFYQKFLEENDLVFDVGANVGERTSALLGVGCRVVAIEPQPDCCKKLKNLEARNGRLTVLQVACGRAEGNAILRTGGGGMCWPPSRMIIFNRSRQADVLLGTSGRKPCL